MKIKHVQTSVSDLHLSQDFTAPAWFTPHFCQFSSWLSNYVSTTEAVIKKESQTLLKTEMRRGEKSHNSKRRRKSLLMQELRSVDLQKHTICFSEMSLNMRGKTGWNLVGEIGLACFVNVFGVLAMYDYAQECIYVIFIYICEFGVSRERASMLKNRRCDVFDRWLEGLPVTVVFSLDNWAKIVLFCM